ncbi:hypothetical protein O3M35_006943 [Rhynocoris fuscipes]|uniref:Uncharacterized protein n=1 Tax=Rhynocoris fuscipes TaxID=488301 RepID=A0AAW1DJ22_9HEMI
MACFRPVIIVLIFLTIAVYNSQTKLTYPTEAELNEYKELIAELNKSSLVIFKDLEEGIQRDIDHVEYLLDESRKEIKFNISDDVPGSQ